MSNHVCSTVTALTPACVCVWLLRDNEHYVHDSIVQLTPQQLLWAAVQSLLGLVRILLSGVKIYSLTSGQSCCCISVRGGAQGLNFKTEYIKERAFKAILMSAELLWKQKRKTLEDKNWCRTPQRSASHNPPPPSPTSRVHTQDLTLDQ